MFAALGLAAATLVVACDDGGNTDPADDRSPAVVDDGGVDGDSATDGTATPKISVDYPIGHRKRRAEGVPVLLNKFAAALSGHLPAHRVGQILALTAENETLDSLPVHELIDLFTV